MMRLLNRANRLCGGNERRKSKWVTFEICFGLAKDDLVSEGGFLQFFQSKFSKIKPHCQFLITCNKS